MSFNKITKLSRRNGIVTKHELVAVKQCIRYLKENCTHRGLFINFGSRIIVNKIIGKIRMGDDNMLEFLRNYCTPRECATALNQFLRNIGKPLLSKRVQQLILGDNEGICPRVIALDALSLLSEDLEGPHRDLFISLMDMMRTLSTVGCLRPTEVRVSHAPYLLIPLLFSSTEKITRNWRNMADILNEMIICFNSFLEGERFRFDDNTPIHITSPPPNQLRAPESLSQHILYEPLIRRPIITSRNRLDAILSSYMIRLNYS